MFPRSYMEGKKKKRELYGMIKYVFKGSSDWEERTGKKKIQLGRFIYSVFDFGMNIPVVREWVKGDLKKRFSDDLSIKHFVNTSQLATLEAVFYPFDHPVMQPHYRYIQAMIAPGSSGAVLRRKKPEDEEEEEEEGEEEGPIKKCMNLFVPLGMVSGAKICIEMGRLRQIVVGLSDPSVQKFVKEFCRRRFNIEGLFVDDDEKKDDNEVKLLVENMEGEK